MDEDYAGMNEQQIALAGILSSITAPNGETYLTASERQEILLDWAEQFPYQPGGEPTIEEVEVTKEDKSIEYLVGGLLIGYVLAKFVLK